MIISDSSFASPSSPERFVAQAIDPLAQRPATIITGEQGEDAAQRFLELCGYTILARNVRIGSHDEIDIVAFDPQDDVIVFAEVKTRTSFSESFRPELNLTQRKRRALTRAARAWIAEKEWEEGYRLDLLCVVNGRVVEHYREIAFSDD